MVGPYLNFGIVLSTRKFKFENKFLMVVGRTFLVSIGISDSKMKMVGRNFKMNF